MNNKLQYCIELNPVKLFTKFSHLPFIVPIRIDES